MNDYSFLPPHPRNKAQVPIKVEIDKLEETADILGDGMKSIGKHHENGLKSVGGGLWAVGVGLGVGLTVGLGNEKLEVNVICVLLLCSLRLQNRNFTLQ